MALIKCKECGEEVSRKAESCPKCGAPQKAKQYSLFGLIGVLFFGWIIYSIYSGIGDTKVSPSPAEQSRLTENELQQLIAKLEVISYNCDKSHGYVWVQGEVRNISDQKLENVVAVGEFRTESGDFVKSEDALIEYNPIMPGQTSPFKSGGTDNPQISNCSLAFKHIYGRRILHINSYK